MGGDADADFVKMVVIKVVKIWVFGEDEGELAGDVLFN